MPFLDNPNLESINNLTTLLYLFAHRNKNQHRRSIWWRHFSIFRRQVDTLEHEVKQLVATPSTHVERTQLKAEAPKIKTRIEQRVESWPISRWHHAFSQLAADGRFAQLGLVLLAALAQICALTELTLHLEALGEIEIQQVLHDFGREHWQNEKSTALDDAATEDTGAAVSRDAIVKHDHDNIVKTKTPTKDRSKRVRSNKSKSKNAIDELFGGL